MVTYSIYHNYEEIVSGAESEESAIEQGDDWLYENTDGDGLRNGAVIAIDVDLVTIDDDDNEIARKTVMLEYEHYHGDLAEHGTY